MTKPSPSSFRRSLAGTGPSLLLLASLLVGEASAQPLNSEGIQPNEVKRGVAAENAKLDLTMCAPEVDVLSKASESAAIAEIAQNPECRRAIVRAQEAGLTRSQIVDTLMAGSGVPDPDPGTPSDGND
jgi:hypothetical protein